MRRAAPVPPGAAPLSGSRTWGLALSGGGVLGAAHLGVLRALEEWGYAPAVEVGASAGGLVTGARASGLSTEAATAFFRSVCASPWRFALGELISFHRGLLSHELLGLLSLRPMLRALAGTAPRTTVAEWPAGSAVMTVDLGRPGGLVRVQGGSDFGGAVDALQATSALPGLFAALRRGEHLYVDGGLADDLPVEAAFALGADRVLSVNVGGSLPMAALPEAVSLGEVVARAVAFGTATLTQAANPDRGPVLALRPEVPAGAGLLSFGGFDALVDAGYRAAAASRDAIVEFLSDAPDDGTGPTPPQGPADAPGRAGAAEAVTEAEVSGPVGGGGPES